MRWRRSRKPFTHRPRRATHHRITSHESASLHRLTNAPAVAPSAAHGAVPVAPPGAVTISGFAAARRPSLDRLPGGESATARVVIGCYPARAAPGRRSHGHGRSTGREPCLASRSRSCRPRRRSRRTILVRNRVVVPVLSPLRFDPRGSTVAVWRRLLQSVRATICPVSSSCLRHVARPERRGGHPIHGGRRDGKRHCPSPGSPMPQRAETGDWFVGTLSNRRHGRQRATRSRSRGSDRPGRGTLRVVSAGRLGGARDPRRRPIDDAARSGRKPIASRLRSRTIAQGWRRSTGAFQNPSKSAFIPLHVPAERVADILRCPTCRSRRTPTRERNSVHPRLSTTNDTAGSRARLSPRSCGASFACRKPRGLRRRARSSTRRCRSLRRTFSILGRDGDRLDGRGP